MYFSLKSGGGKLAGILKNIIREIKTYATKNNYILKIY